MGIDELYLGKKQKFVTVVSNLESQEPLWFGEERKKETLDEFFRTQLSRKQRGRIEAACLGIWSRTGEFGRLGHQAAGWCTTSSTSCNTPIAPSMKSGGRNSFAKVGGNGGR